MSLGDKFIIRVYATDTPASSAFFFHIGTGEIRQIDMHARNECGKREEVFGTGLECEDLRE